MNMSVTSCKVRKANLDDIRVMTSLLKELYGHDGENGFEDHRHRAGLRRLIAQKDAAVLVAEMEDLVVGMCTVQTVVATAEGTLAGLLEDMVVHDKFRGQGVGTALLGAAERWAAEHKLGHLRIITGEENAEALVFYKARGWRMTHLAGLRRTIERRRGYDN